MGGGDDPAIGWRRIRRAGPGKATAAAAILLVWCWARVSRADLSDDAEGLRTWYAALSSGSNSLAGWSSNNTSSGNNSSVVGVCEWQGVECRNTSAGEIRVLFVRLGRAGLEGPIPEASIGRLTQLRVLNLHHNRLSGPLPSDLSNCSFLRSIYLQGNRLHGSIPSSFFARWPNLNHIDLSANSLSGPIPSSVANLSQLKSLYLHNNSLSGGVPPIEIATLANFSVANNNLSGAVPNTTTLSKFLGTGAFAGNPGLCGGGPLPACPPPITLDPGSGNNNNNNNSSSSSSPKKKRLTGGEIAGIVIGCVGVVFIVATLLILAFNSRNRRSGINAGKAAAREVAGPIAAAAAAGAGYQPPAAEAAAAEMRDLVFFDRARHLRFSMDELLRASAEVLGKGSIGTSYKAVLETGLVVAVKRLKDVTAERREFEAAMERLGAAMGGHDGLVPALAYYYAREEKLLVSEYMANGSLSAVLHGNKGASRTALDWDARVRIADGVARGLEQLHAAGIAHGNLKSSNVLLTKGLRGAAVSDYGLTPLVSVGAAAANGRALGYRAPEAVAAARSSAGAAPEADVYSYGVLLMELLTGRPPVQAAAAASSGDDDGAIDLPRWVLSVPPTDWRSHLLDKELAKLHAGNTSSSSPAAADAAAAAEDDELASLLRIALTCTSPSPDQRPTMSKVVEQIAHLLRDKP